MPDASTKRRLIRNLKRIDHVSAISLTALSLLAPVASASEASAKWHFTEHGAPYGEDDRDKRLCTVLLARLNSFRWNSMESQQCSYGVLASYPGFREPKWQPLDAQEHADLLTKVFKYKQEGPDEYFKRLEPGKKKQSLEHYSEGLGRFIGSDGKFYVWNFPLLTVRTPNGKLENPVQTILQQRSEIDGEMRTKICKDKPQIEWWGPTVILKPDLSGPDEAVSPGQLASILGGSLLLFEDVPYFVSGYSVRRNHPVSLVKTVCTFEFRTSASRGR